MVHWIDNACSRAAGMALFESEVVGSKPVRDIFVEEEDGETAW